MGSTGSFQPAWSPKRWPLSIKKAGVRAGSHGTSVNTLSLVVMVSHRATMWTEDDLRLYLSSSRAR